MLISRVITKGAGYLVNDDRASGGKLTEADIFTCSHCQKILVREQWKVKGGFCVKCSQQVCFECLGKIPKEGCSPFIKKVEEQLDKQYHRNQLNKLIGG